MVPRVHEIEVSVKCEVSGDIDKQDEADVLESQGSANMLHK
jgi:hypothetical protein